MMLLKSSSILPCLDSVLVFVLTGEPFSGSALYITIVETPAILKVNPDHW